MLPSGRRFGPSIAAFAAAIALAVGGWVASGLFRLAAAAEGLPLWDMAWNGWLGLVLAEDLRSGRLLDFLVHLDQHDVWPFATSLLLAPLFLLFGPGFWPPLLLGTTLFAASLALLVLVAREVDPTVAGSAAGLLAAALFLGAAELRLLSVIVLREIPGVFFTLAALALYLRARRLGGLTAFRLAGVAALALVFVKVNYGLVLLLAVLLDDLLRAGAARRRLILGKISASLWPGRQGSVARWLLAGALWLLAVLFVAGVSIGNAAYGLLLISTIGVVRSLWGHLAEVRRRMATLRPEVRAVVETVVLPLWLWCLSPGHLKGLLGFLHNRSSGLSWRAGLLFYPRSVLTEYAISPAIGTAVLLLALVALPLAWRRGGAPRTLALFFLLQVFSLLVHPYKLSRFAATAVPQLFSLAGLAVVWLLVLASRRLGGVARVSVTAGVLIAALAALVGVAAISQARQPELADRLAASSSPAELRPVLDHLAESFAGATRVALLGAFDELSPWLVSWRLAQTEETRATRVVRALRRFSGGLPRSAAAQRVTAWLDDRGPDRLAAIHLHAESVFAQRDDYQTVNAWQERAIAVLPELVGWRSIETHRYPQLEVEVEIWQFTGGTEPPPRGGSR